MAQPNNSLAGSTVQIAAEPNVVLVIGPEKKRLLVCSYVLRNASKYFRALFGPNFSEGQGLGDSNTLKIILMPEDDADALEIICNIAHLRCHSLPKGIETTMYLRVVITMDKFVLQSVMMPHIEQYLRFNSISGRDLSTTAQRTVAAYIINDSTRFKEATWAMMYEQEDSFISLTTMELGLDKGLVWRIIFLLEEGRNHMHRDLQSVLLNSTYHTLSNCEGGVCEWGRHQAYSFMQCLHHTEERPGLIAKGSVEDAVEEFDNLSDQVGCGVSCESGDHSNFEVVIDSDLAEFWGRHAGLCIDHIKSLESGVRHECRLKDCVYCKPASDPSSTPTA